MEKLLTTSDTNKDVIIVNKYDGKDLYEMFIDGKHVGQMSYNVKKIIFGGNYPCTERFILGNSEGKFFCRGNNHDGWED